MKMIIYEPWVSFYKTKKEKAEYLGWISYGEDEELKCDPEILKDLKEKGVFKDE